MQPEPGRMIERIEKYFSNGKQGIGCIIGDLCNLPYGQKRAFYLASGK